MKKHVTMAELQAAAALLTGVPADNLMEIHVVAGTVTAVERGKEDKHTVKRIPIFYDLPSKVDEDDGP